jgi:hypothetical protein
VVNLSPLLRGEKLISLAAAARLLPGHRGGNHVHPATLSRWIAKGTRTPDGRLVRLEAVRAGSRWLTTAEAVGRYIERLTPAVSTDNLRSPSARRRASDAASRALGEMGA